MASVQLRHIEHQFGDCTALSELNLEVDSGAYVALLGENGCGKTTALRVIAGLLTPCNGSVFLGGKCVDGIPPRRRSVGMMMQGTSLYPHLNVQQNINFGLPTHLKTTHLKITQAKTAQSSSCGLSAGRVIEIVDIGNLLDRFPHELSGGQLRRVAIAKAIAGDSPIRLFDEPLSAIDSTTSSKLEQDLVQVHHTIGGTTIHVTHDSGEAMRIADKIAVMHEGRLLQYDSPEVVLNQPNSVHVANRIAGLPVNWFRADTCDNTFQFEHSEVVTSGDWSHFLERFQKLPAKILIGVRPERLAPTNGCQKKPHLTVRPTDTTLRDTGLTSSWLASIQGQTFRAMVAGPKLGVSPHQVEATQFQADAEDVMLFDAETGLAINPAVSR